MAIALPSQGVLTRFTVPRQRHLLFVRTARGRTDAGTTSKIGGAEIDPEKSPPTPVLMRELSREARRGASNIAKLPTLLGAAVALLGTLRQP